MTRDEAELFVNDVRLIAQGIEGFFSRTTANADLSNLSLAEVIMEIQRTGALEDIPGLFARIVSKIPPSMLGELPMGLLAIDMPKDPQIN